MRYTDLRQAKRWLPRLVVVVFCGAASLLYRALSQYDPAEIVAAIFATSPRLLAWPVLPAKHRSLVRLHCRSTVVHSSADHNTHGRLDTPQYNSVHAAIGAKTAARSHGVDSPIACSLCSLCMEKESIDAPPDGTEVILPYTPLRDEDRDHLGPYDAARSNRDVRWTPVSIQTAWDRMAPDETECLIQGHEPSMCQTKGIALGRSQIGDRRHLQET